MKLRIRGIALLLSLSASMAFAQEATREDFNKYRKANVGRWVGDITLVADFPGFGKRGEKIVLYSETQAIDDGNALLVKTYGGAGSATGLITYDARRKRIRSQWSDSAGGFNRSILFFKDGKWVEEGRGCLPDGTEVKFTNSAALSADGNTATITGTGTVGGKKADDQHDVWRRLSK